MDQDQTEIIQYWTECWTSSLLTLDSISDDIQADIWNKRSHNFGKDGDEDRQKKKNKEFFDILEEAGFTPKGATVLDIGCGPGSLSLPLAQAGAHVTALDISHGMLERLSETAEQKGLSIKTIETSWWTVDIDKLGLRNSFDLVIASKTPSIRDVESFNRMVACSRDYCYFSGFIRKDPPKIPAEVYVQILKEVPEMNSFASAFIYPFMYLYSLGIHPIVRFAHRNMKYEEPWSEAAEKTIDSLKTRRDLSEDMKHQIQEYYKKMSKNGMSNSDYEMFSGSMVWQIQK
ncbi:class I SAM-dependent methyltransferase [Methanospirillum lacunae]|uniref:Methyltransferase n=1 Tax=Methanospirillum lacunae TaxID=668570 RepID=A0A2V2N7R9_9EURY|nr:class I SAM-dependent methyltransferase [Methanospirillum lacunae]PWR71323.1 methyltransferase [Methanospirillum lacunae]